jgi:photosystem II stability/assembly factor-like uncharacterized protein
MAMGASALEDAARGTAVALLKAIPMKWLIILILSINAAAQWRPLESHTRKSLRGIGVSGDTVWATGTHGTYLLSQDGGATWTGHQVPGAESLDFRGVVAFGASAFLLAAGPGELSRIYYTAHLGDDWKIQFANHAPKGFFDCMAFFDERHGIVVGDPLNGRFEILRSNDGGASWHSEVRVMPAAIEGEGAFAASNSCVTTHGDKNVWFVTGGKAARVFRSEDGGDTWQVSDSPIVHGEASTGIFSVAFRDSLHGVIAGGDYLHPEREGANLATTSDGGRSWKLASIAPQRFFSAVAYVAEDGIILAGSSASALSRDGLHSWQWFSSEGFNAVAVRPGGEFVYGAGGDGRVAATTKHVGADALVRPAER